MTGTPGLTRTDCLRLIGAAGLGRVVFTDAAMPAVQPVAFVLDGDDAVFRVLRGGRLDIATRGTVVGFQVDSIDPRTHAGWSVLGVGRAYELTDPGRIAELPAGWGADATTHTVAVPLEQLSGRRIRLGPPGGRDLHPGPTTPQDETCGRGGGGSVRVSVGPPDTPPTVLQGEIR